MSNKLKKDLNKKIIGKRSRNRGHAYERKIVNELKNITGDEDLCTSRSESKKLDDMKIDIADPNNTLSFYCQIKSTQQTPQIKKINLGVIYILKICYNVLVAVGEPCIIHKLGGLQNG